MCWGACPASVPDVPGIPPWKWVRAGGSREKLSAAAPLQPRPGAQAWMTASPERLQLERGLPSSNAGSGSPVCLDLDFDLDLRGLGILEA